MNLFSRQFDQTLRFSWKAILGGFALRTVLMISPLRTFNTNLPVEMFLFFLGLFLLSKDLRLHESPRIDFLIRVVVPTVLTYVLEKIFAAAVPVALYSIINIYFFTASALFAIAVVFGAVKLSEKKISIPIITSAWVGSMILHAASFQNDLRLLDALRNGNAYSSMTTAGMLYHSLLTAICYLPFLLVLRIPLSPIKTYIRPSDELIGGQIRMNLEKVKNNAIEPAAAPPSERLSRSQVNPLNEARDTPSPSIELISDTASQDTTRRQESASSSAVSTPVESTPFRISKPIKLVVAIGLLLTVIALPLARDYQSSAKRMKRLVANKDMEKVQRYLEDLVKGPDSAQHLKAVTFGAKALLRAVPSDADEVNRIYFESDGTDVKESLLSMLNESKEQIEATKFAALYWTARDLGKHDTLKSQMKMWTAAKDQELLFQSLKQNIKALERPLFLERSSALPETARQKIAGLLRLTSLITNESDWSIVVSTNASLVSIPSDNFVRSAIEILRSSSEGRTALERLNTQLKDFQIETFEQALKDIYLGEVSLGTTLLATLPDKAATPNIDPNLVKIGLNLKQAAAARASLTKKISDAKDEINNQTKAYQNAQEQWVFVRGILVGEISCTDNHCDYEIASATDPRYHFVLSTVGTSYVSKGVIAVNAIKNGKTLITTKDGRVQEWDRFVQVTPELQRIVNSIQHELIGIRELLDARETELSQVEREVEGLIDELKAETPPPKNLAQTVATNIKGKDSSQSQVFECETPKHLIYINSLDVDTYRYRAWPSEEMKHTTPTLELKNGTMSTDGSGACRYSRFVFKSGSYTYSVGELGCTDGSEPSNAIGKLEVERDGKLLSEQWCLSK